MRFYPRNAQSRDAALHGSGHIGNHGAGGAGDYQTARDRMLRYKPATVVDSIPNTYGGTGG